MTEPVDARTRVILDALTKHARPLIREHFRADSCIASTRVAIETLTYFGITAEPIPLLVMVFNGEATQMLRDGVDLAELSEITARHMPEDPGGPWSIALGSGQQNRTLADPGWAGHLVAGLPEQQIVVDLSIDQISRPLKNMTFEPTWMSVPEPNWWSGGQPHVDFTTQQGTCLVLDRNAIDPDGYKASENWTAKGPSKAAIKNIVGQTIRLIRHDLTTNGQPT